MLLCDTIVPFTSSGKLDPAALRAHLLWLRAHGIDGFAPGLSECFALDSREKEEIVGIARDAAPDAALLVPVWDPSPARVLRLAAQASELGAVGVVVPPAVLVRVPEDGVLEWYRTLARRVSVPIVVWHDARFDNPLSPAFIARAFDGAAGAVLDASGDRYRVRRLVDAHPGAVWITGEGTSHAHDLRGAAGFVSRVANVYPELAARLYSARDGAVLDAVSQRARGVARAGGVPALKRLLGVHARLPVVGVDETELSRLPPSTFG
jgi:4-hydroxy-tetrahydrodipicolinate synthase